MAKAVCPVCGTNLNRILGTRLTQSPSGHSSADETRRDPSSEGSRRRRLRTFPSRPRPSALGSGLWTAVFVRTVSRLASRACTSSHRGPTSLPASAWSGGGSTASRSGCTTAAGSCSRGPTRSLRTLALLLERGPVDDRSRHGVGARAARPARVPRAWDGAGPDRAGRSPCSAGSPDPVSPTIDELLACGRCRRRPRELHEADAVVVLGGRRARPGTTRSAAPARHQPCRRTPGGRGCRGRPVRRTREDRVPAVHRRAPERARSRPRRGDHALRRATARPRPDGMPDLVDPALATIALAWAVRDVVAHLDGAAALDLVPDAVPAPDPAQRREEQLAATPDVRCSFADEALPRPPAGCGYTPDRHAQYDAGLVRPELVGHHGDMTRTSCPGVLA